MKRIIAITGGIGAGKSVVTHIVGALGFKVYDCDSEAKALMDSSLEIKRRLTDEIDPHVVRSDGTIDRTRLAALVFGDAVMLETLNGIVHEAVRNDIAARCAGLGDGETMFVETAILYQSHLDRMVDEVWEVDAPVDLRIERVMRRNGCDRQSVMARIASQNHTPRRPHDRVFRIVNDGVLPLLPRIERLLGEVV